MCLCVCFRDPWTKLNIKGTQRSQDLKKRVQSVLDNKLVAWQNYILCHCFALPFGFHMPNTFESAWGIVVRAELSFLQPNGS
ncbi:hypothetical protein E2542_SST30117 [Spatholobus suberectus]|nr:hypothetical protein E2542_SST30117 [Spatholobus suberectus]